VVQDFAAGPTAEPHLGNQLSPNETDTLCVGTCQALCEWACQRADRVKLQMEILDVPMRPAGAAAAGIEQVANKTRITNP